MARYGNRCRFESSTLRIGGVEAMWSGRREPFCALWKSAWKPKLGYGRAGGSGYCLRARDVGRQERGAGRTKPDCQAAAAVRLPDASGVVALAPLVEIGEKDTPPGSKGVAHDPLPSAKVRQCPRLVFRCSHVRAHFCAYRGATVAQCLFCPAHGCSPSKAEPFATASSLHCSKAQSSSKPSAMSVAL